MNYLPKNFKSRHIVAQKKSLKSFLIRKCYYSVNDFINDENFNEL